MKEKLLQHRKEIILAIILFLVSTTSFALGYLAHRSQDRAPIIIEKRSE